MADLIAGAPITASSLEERAEFVVETMANMARLPWREEGVITVPLDLSPSTALVRWFRRNDDTAVDRVWAVEVELPYAAEDDDHLRDLARLALRHAYERELLDLRSMLKHVGDEEGRYRSYIATAQDVIAALSPVRLEAVSD